MHIALIRKISFKTRKHRKQRQKKKLVFQIAENAYLQKPLLNRTMTTQG